MEMLRLLHGLALEGVDFHQPKPLLLLAYLNLEGPQARRHLAELFWPGEAKGLRSLTAALVRLKRAVEGAVEAEEIFIKTTLESDAQALLKALDADDAIAAIDRYHGPFLAGVQLPGWGVELEDWVYSTREFLAARVQEAQLRLAEEEAARGDFRAAAKRAETAYTLAGAPVPGPEGLERFYTLLLAGDSVKASLVREEAQGYGIALELTRNEARARLRVKDEADIAKDVQVTPHNLPNKNTSFIGRDPELLELGRLLADESTRLITLCGAGGVGKSRLAVQAAFAELQEGSFRDGIYLVPLETLKDPKLLPAAIAGVLGTNLTYEGLDELVQALENKRLLLVLDNFEQLMAGAMVVSLLIQQCPQLKLLITSRERLNLEDEQLFLVQGLPVPEALSSVEAAQYQEVVQLFTQRAKRTKLDFSLSEANLPHVLKTCQLVEGSPLAIELAAALVRLLPSEEIAAELEASADILATTTRDVVERQRSLRATFEASWQLLSPKEQGVLRKLAVFVGGFTRQAAAEVAGATIPLLMALVDKSLLRVLPGGRYDRHPLLYEYTLEKLAEQPEEQARAQAKHASVFLAVAEEAEARLRGTEQTERLRRLEAEHDNLRAALHWMQQQGEAQMGLRLAGALSSFWDIRSYLSEGRAWLETFLASPAAAQLTTERVKALNSAGKLASRQGEHAQAQKLLRESLEISRAQQDKTGMAFALTSLGNVAWFQGDYLQARAFYEESLNLQREMGDKQGIAVSLVNLGNIAELQGDYPTARAFHEEGLALRRADDDQHALATSLFNLGNVTYQQGDYQTAQALVEESLVLSQDLEDSWGMWFSLSLLGNIAANLGDYASAWSWHQESLEMSRKSNDKWSVATSRSNLGMVALFQANDEARVLFAESLELRREINDKWGMAYGLIGLAGVAVQMDKNADRAVRLSAAAETTFASLGIVMEKLFRLIHEEVVVAARAALGEEVFTTVWAEGEQMPLKEAVAYGLEGITLLSKVF